MNQQNSGGSQWIDDASGVYNLQRQAFSGHDAMAVDPPVAMADDEVTRLLWAANGEYRHACRALHTLMIIIIFDPGTGFQMEPPVYQGTISPTFKIIIFT